MEKDEEIKNPIFQKDDLFLDHLNHQKNTINQDFIRGNMESYDEYFCGEEIMGNEGKSVNISYELSPISYRTDLNKFKEKILNGGKDKNCLDNNKDTFSESKCDNNPFKKQLFNTLQDIESTFDMKKRRLIMNRESAKKSRLKKKKYIENLEKEYLILKEEIVRLKSSQNLNYKYNFHLMNEEILNNIIIDNEIDNRQNNLDIDLDLNLNINNAKDKEIVNLKKEEFNIVSNHLEKEPNAIDNYINQQKKILQNLLIRQIALITPESIKEIKNKFLKLEEIKRDDSISVIKNKINSNLEAIIELYDVDITENQKEKNTNKVSSKGINIYNFYHDLKSYVEQYEFLYNQLDNFIK